MKEKEEEKFSVKKKKSWNPFLPWQPKTTNKRLDFTLLHFTKLAKYCKDKDVMVVSNFIKSPQDPDPDEFPQENWGSKVNVNKFVFVFSALEDTAYDYHLYFREVATGQRVNKNCIT